MSERNSVKSLTVIGLMTAVMCVLAPFSILLPGMVPISLGTLVLYFYPYILGTKRSALCCLIYILIGAAGLPVFTGFTGGLPKIAGPTGGYMLGYFLIILFEGAAIKRFPGFRTAHVVGIVMGTVGCYLLGTLWLAHVTKLGFTSALMAGVIPFIPGDAAKAAVAVIFAPVIRDRLKKAGSLPKSEA